MLEYNDITSKKVIILDGEPYAVLTSHVFRKQQRKPVNQTKLKNLITGKVVERSFHQSETAEEAEIELRPVEYIYENHGQYWFCDPNDKSKRFSLPEDLVGPEGKFLKKGVIDAVVFQEKIIELRVPVKMDLLVVSAPQAVKGNTVQGGTKQATLETGVVVSVPMFVNEGDVVRVNTETGEYVERVEKK